LKKSIKFTIVLAVTLIICSCSTYYLSKQSLVEQLKENQTIAVDKNYQIFSLIEYPSNNLRKIKCLDKDSNIVWLFPDKNTEFMIYKKSDGDKITVYFDTLILQQDTLYGLRSRLLGGKRIIPVNDVDRVEIYAEFPTTQMISEKNKK
jgi:hypothetical protein